MAYHNDLGEWGELVAIDYLKGQGYFVSEHDWHLGHKDIDIIAIDNTTKEIVFVEVKTRRDNVFGEPEDAIDSQKIRNLKSAASAYLNYHQISRQMRFDIISITGTTDENMRLKHFPDAFH
ncbi:MAG: YraN family protein [Prevotella sp.]|nr:YraN family protein [Prevotella sp.]